MSDFRYRVQRYDLTTGVRIGPPPVPMEVELATPMNDIPTGKFKFAPDPQSDGSFLQSVTAPAEVGVEISTDGGSTWTEPRNMRFAIIQDGKDRLTTNTPEGVTGVGMAWMLKKALVFRTAGTELDADLRRVFSGSTPGAMIRTLVLEAQARSVLNWLDISTFNATTDSLGVPWPKQLNLSLDAGTELDKILLNLGNAGIVDWEMQGRQLRLYVPGTYFGVTATNVVLYEGRDLTEAGVSGSYEELAARLLTIGDEGELYTTDYVGAETPWGKWEAATTISGTTDATTIDSLSQTSLDVYPRKTQQKTYTVKPQADGAFQPWVDYRLGHLIAVRAGAQTETLQWVRQMTLRGDGTGGSLVTLVLGDRFRLPEVRFHYRLRGPLRGVGSPGGSGTTPTAPVDKKPPAAPTDFLFDSVAAILDGIIRADLSVSWGAVTTNFDSTPTSDVDHYEVQYALPGLPTRWKEAGITRDNNIIIPGLPPLTLIEVRVRAVDKSNNLSDWGLSSFTTVTDTTAPQVPSTPVGFPYFGTLVIEWDGLSDAATPMDEDLRSVEIHASDDAIGFAPNDSTLKGQFLRGGQFQIDGFTYGVDVYVKLVAVDRSGNRSDPSGTIVLTPEQITDVDVQSFSAAKITTGVLQAGARIIAGIDLGRRVELNGTGFYVYDPQPEDIGQPDQEPVIKFGTADPSYLSIWDPTQGQVVASIDATGVVSGQVISSTADAFVSGDPLLGNTALYQPPSDEYKQGWLDVHPRGVVAYGDFAGSTLPSATGPLVDVGVIEMSFDAVAGRMYRISVSSTLVNVPAGAQAAFLVICAQPIEEGGVATAPLTTSAGLIGYHYTSVNKDTVTRFDTLAWNKDVPCVPDVARTQYQIPIRPGTNRLLLMLRSVLSGTVDIYNGQTPTMTVEDIGMVAPDLTSLYDNVTPPEPTKPPRKTYTSVWKANYGATYQGDGDKRSDTSDIVQGQNSFNGNGKGIFGFTAGAISGETGKSITSALSGATISSIYAYIYFNHWWFNSGGTAILGYHGLTSAPASSPSITSNQLQVGGWKKPEGKWVKLPTSWHAGIKAGTIRGLALGPGPSTSLTYYGRADGHTGSRPPQLKITYTR